MSFYQTLLASTESSRTELYSVGIIQKALNGSITLLEYVSFLSQAYHHVKHTVPLLMAVGARLPDSHEWLRSAVAEYIEEELGHQEWILNDIAACGFDKDSVRHGRAAAATELMVAYAYDLINRVHPIGFFGMVHVLEGTSIAVADNAAVSIGTSLGLPKKAFSYLISHGELDVSHVEFFAGLMNKITDEKEQAMLLHSADMFYQLYRNVFVAAEQLAALPNDQQMQTLRMAS